MNHKKYIIISGLNLRDNNRGTAALGYGAISFLQQQIGRASCRERV